MAVMVVMAVQADRTPSFRPHHKYMFAKRNYAMLTLSWDALLSTPTFVSVMLQWLSHGIIVFYSIAFVKSLPAP